MDVVIFTCISSVVPSLLSHSYTKYSSGENSLTQLIQKPLVESVFAAEQRQLASRQIQREQLHNPQLAMAQLQYAKQQLENPLYWSSLTVFNLTLSMLCMNIPFILMSDYQVFINYLTMFYFTLLSWIFHGLLLWSVLFVIFKVDGKKNKESDNCSE